MASSFTPYDSQTAQAEESLAARHVAAFFEKFERDRYECQELLWYTITNLFMPTDDLKLATEPPLGIVTHVAPVSDSRMMFLVPQESGIDSLDMRVVHQIVKELTYGIFVFNQTPTISLEPNFDLSTSCQMPPVYHDTHVGQLLINVDYMLKALWHGTYFPKEKRIKFSERWRSSLDVNDAGKPETRKDIFNEFQTAGLIDITMDKDYARVYDSNDSSNSSTEEEINDERKFFMSHVENLTLKILFHQNSIQQFRNLFVVDSAWDVVSVVQRVDEEFDAESYERLNACLQKHRKNTLESLCKKPEICQEMFLLKLISFLVPFLIAMKKKMKIPDLNRMFPNMTTDETRTERDLPPLMIGQEFKCKNFQFPTGTYFHLHGGMMFDLETTNPVAPSQSVINAYDEIKTETDDYIAKYLDNPNPTYQETYPAPVVDIEGQRYFAMALDFETFYPQSPQRPKWVASMTEEMTKLRQKRLPMQDIQIHEQFKKYMGYMRAIRYKNLPIGLRSAATRGLVAIFASLCRKSPSSRLGKHDELGMSLIHYAAMYNRPQILGALMLQSLDVNLRQISSIIGQGPTPLHLAARCGSLDAVCSLLTCGASMLMVDKDGWAPIHYASYYGHPRIVFLMVRKSAHLLELQTKNEQKSTPLLLAASSGAVSVLKCLIDRGAYVLSHDENGDNAIHLAALRFHTNVLEFFIRWNHVEVDVWQTLIGMLKHEDLGRKVSAVKCLQALTLRDSDYYSNLLHAGGVPVLVDLLKIDNTNLHLLTTSVLCNISSHAAICEALSDTDAIAILVRLLDSSDADVQSRASIVVADLGAIESNQKTIADNGGIVALVKMLDSSYEDVLVNAVNALRVLCHDNRSNQTEVGESGAVASLVEFLSVSSDVLQATAAAAIAALTFKHKENQDAVVNEGPLEDGAVKSLVHLIKGHSINVQIKSALAVQALTENNEASQAIFLQFDTARALIRLLKMFSMEVKEQAAVSLWSLAGHTKTRQRYIAECIGIPMLVEMLLRDSDSLQYVGCMAMMAVGYENVDSQNSLVEFGAIRPLVRLMRLPKTSKLVLITVIKALATLSVGLAYKNNKLSQNAIAEENAITLLVEWFLNPPSEDVQVEVAYALGCLVLGNAENQAKLNEEEEFSFNTLRQLLNSSREEIRLRAGFAFSIFSFNNTVQQFAIREAGGLGLDCFRRFLASDDEFERATAAFQVVVLSRVVTDADQVSLTARGVKCLVEILNSLDDDAVIMAAGFISGLSHTRAGIPDAMVTVGAIQLLSDRLSSSNDQVRFSCAVALGYLTYNRTATRYLLSACRNRPGLYERLMSSIGKNPRINSEFVEEFRRAKIIGLPCLSLEIYGGRTKNGKRRAISVIGRSPASPFSPYPGSPTLYSVPSRSVSAAVAKTRFNPRPKSSVHFRQSPEPTTVHVTIDDLRTKKDAAAAVALPPREPAHLPNDSKSFKSRLSAWESG